jgi:TolA-binding protein
MRRTFVFLAVLVLGLVSSAVVVGQEDGQPAASDVERLVREGRVEALQARFRGGRSPDELRLLALAQANRAAQVRDDRRRQRAFQEAEARHLTWISAEERNRDVTAVERAVNAAAARATYAGMILSQWAAADLDEFELTNGKGGTTGRLLELLLKARRLYEQADEAVRPLADELRDAGPKIEDRYLALGVFDTVPRLRLDIRFNLAWTSLYIGIVDSKNTTRRSEGLRSAERAFQDLVDRGPDDETATRCLLGLAMTLREQGRGDEARRYFDSALQAARDAALAAQVRYERARSEIRHGQFEEARITLRPLVDKDPDALPLHEQPARFYVNLAHLWEANSYLEEARRLRRTAEASSARDAMVLRAKRLREIGLRKMNRLAQRGGSWPALVQLYVSDSIASDADEQSLSAAELLFSARQYTAERKHRHALAQLQEAASRQGVASDLAAEILFDLGVCHYRCRQNREAAEVFARMAQTYKSHEKAAEAVTYAYRLWASIAEETGAREDYLHLANVLLNLLQSFPEHEKRAEAGWWLPVALQAAGRYQQALRHFGSVPSHSPHWEEAQLRQALCARSLLEAERESLSDLPLRARAVDVTSKLKSYARQAYQRADEARDPNAVRRWSAEALINAAEVHTWPRVAQYQDALDLLEGFEQRYPSSPQIGRVLAVRISACRGLGQFDRAARVVDQFLRTVPPGQAGGTLAVVARGMQAEVERLEERGDRAAARKLASQSIRTFEQLENWVLGDPDRAEHVDSVWYGLARMRYLAGQHQQARELVAELLRRDTRNGNYQRLNALVLTAALPDDASAGQIAEARAAWGAMLRDPALRSAFPERYWEARYHYLELLLREGRAAEVENAIRQERVWYPELGGADWRAKLNDLHQRARDQLGKPGRASRPSASQPATDEAAAP